jgi:Proton-conducting membrane transporter/LAGLIDADG endonuclease
MIGLGIMLFLPILISIIFILKWSNNLIFIDKKISENNINKDYFIEESLRIQSNIKKIGLITSIILLGISIYYWGLFHTNTLDYDLMSVRDSSYTWIHSWNEGVLKSFPSISDALKNGLHNWNESMTGWINFKQITQIDTRTGIMYDFIKVQEQKLTGRIDWSLGLDGISIYFYILTTVITPIVILSNWNSIEKKINYYIIIILLVELILLLVFLVKDLLLFYIFFESVLPPLFMLIGLYGSSEKTRAAFYFFLYTLLGSLFMLLAFLDISGEQGSTNIEYIKELNLFYYYQKILWIGIFLSFAVKTPLIPVHLWLPLAHAESPVGGSVYLAGVILKIALYGCLRILLTILPIATLYYTSTVYIIAVITIIYASLTTLRQIDLKVMVAYSSIGQFGPLFKNVLQRIILFLFFIASFLTQQTVCGKFRKNNIFYIILLLQNTKDVSNLMDSILVKIFVWLNNPQITNTRRLFFIIFENIFQKLSMLVGISEAIRLLSAYSLNFLKNLEIINLHKGIFKYSTFSQNQKENEKRFNEWLAGLIDGDGYFYISKQGSVNFEITMDLRDERCLYLIKQKFGGSVKLKSGVKAVRYRLHHKKGFLNLIDAINGLIRNPIRMLQLNKICTIYNIEFINPKPLVYNNGWLSGFFDSDGSIYINFTNGSLIISFTQKNKLLLDPLIDLYGGRIEFHHLEDGTFKWSITKKDEIFSLYNNYFSIYSSRSKKIVRLNMINKYYELRTLKSHLAESHSVLGKALERFKEKWNDGFKS